MGGHIGEEQIEFGQKALRLPARSAPDAVARLVEEFAARREAGEDFTKWLERIGGASAVATMLEPYGEIPEPDLGPEFYVDFDETGPYVASVAESECAT